MTAPRTARVESSNRPELMTREQVAAWLHIKPRQVERFGIPFVDFGRKTKRYLLGDVLDWLDAKRSTPSRSTPPSP